MDFDHCLEVKKCGFRLLYEKDIEDIREMIQAQSSNSTCITPYEDLDAHHNFDNSTEGMKLRRSRDEYEGDGASGEASYNDVPYSKRIERQRIYELMVTLIARILMKGLVSHHYIDFVASYWAYIPFVFVFGIFKLRNYVKSMLHRLCSFLQAMIQRNPPCPHDCLQDIYSLSYFFWSKCHCHYQFLKPVSVKSLLCHFHFTTLYKFFLKRINPKFQ